MDSNQPPNPFWSDFGGDEESVDPSHHQHSVYQNQKDRERGDTNRNMMHHPQKVMNVKR